MHAHLGKAGFNWPKYSPSRDHNAVNSQNTSARQVSLRAARRRLASNSLTLSGARQAYVEQELENRSGAASRMVRFVRLKDVARNRIGAQDYDISAASTAKPTAVLACTNFRAPMPSKPRGVRNSWRAEGAVSGDLATTSLLIHAGGRRRHSGNRQTFWEALVGNAGRFCFPSRWRRR